MTAFLIRSRHACVLRSDLTLQLREVSPRDDLRIRHERVVATGPATARNRDGSSTFVGKPQNVAVQNTLNFALAVEDHVTDRFDLMAEILATTAAGTSGVPEGSSSPEIAGAEQVGMAGFRYALRARAWISLGVTYDNSNALLFRPGLTLETPF